jgi:hypothetical protein
MSGYLEKYPAGSRVCVADRQQLEEFLRTWRLHHPLNEDQPAFAGREAAVAAVGFYHGGDVLYELTDIPGTWHEACLRPAEQVAGAPRAI